MRRDISKYNRVDFTNNMLVNKINIFIKDLIFLSGLFFVLKDKI